MADVVPNIPASVLDQRAADLISIAESAVRLAIETAPNWNRSRFVVEDIRRLNLIHRDLLALTQAEPPEG